MQSFLSPISEFTETELILKQQVLLIKDLLAPGIKPKASSSSGVAAHQHDKQAPAKALMHDVISKSRF